MRPCGQLLPRHPRPEQQPLAGVAETRGQCGASSPAAKACLAHQDHEGSLPPGDWLCPPTRETATQGLCPCGWSSPISRC